LQDVQLISASNR